MDSSSRRQFVDQIARLVIERFPLVKVEPDEAHFSLRMNGHVASLENLYRVSQHEPQHLHRHVERWVVELLRAAEGSPDQSRSFEELRDRIFPMVLADPPAGMPRHAMVGQPLVEGLVVAYAVDSDRSIAYIPRKHFETWKISIDEMHEAAMTNLIARSDTLSAHAAVDEAGQVNLILIQTMDGYDASRILLPMLHEQLRPHLGSPFLAGIPNRDVLLCFRNDPATVQRVSDQIASDYRTMPHQVTDRLFLITPDGIAPYKSEEL